MAQVKQSRKVVKVLDKGQITIPREFRDALGIQKWTLLNVYLAGDHLEIAPLRDEEDALRRYTDEDIARFLEEDKLDEKTAKRVRGLLKSGKL